MTTDPQRKPGPPATLERPALGLDPIFEALDGHRGGLSPEDLKVGSERLEQAFRTVLLPALGINAFLVGLIEVGELGGPGSGWLLGLVLAAAVIASMMLVSRHQRDVALGAALSAILLCGVGLFPGAPALLGVVACTAVAARLASAGELSEWAAIVFTVYFGAGVLTLTESVSPPLRLLVEGAGLAALFAAFWHRQMRKSAFVAVIVAVAIGVFESAAQKQPWALPVLLGVFALLCVVYELRLEEPEQSDLRGFVAQGGLVVVLAAMVFPLFEEPEEAWVWAVAVLLAEAALALKNPGSLALRAVWGALALVVALTLPGYDLSWNQSGAIILALAIGLQLLAQVLQRRFTSDAAILMGLGVAAQVVWNTLQWQPSLVVTTLGVLTACGLIFMSGARALPSGPRWWRGFIAQDHLDAVYSGVAAVLRPVGRSPVGSWVRSIGQTVYRWTSYLKGPRPLEFRDVVLVVGHVLGTFVIAAQWASLRNATAGELGRDPLPWAVPWLVWGLEMMLIGSRRGDSLLRFAGIGLQVTPIVTWVVSGPALDLESAELVAATGLALWLSSWFVGSEAHVVTAEASSPEQST